MASLGRLVAGISHELNTPVGIAVTAASHLQIKANALEKAMKGNGLKKSELEKFVKTSIESSLLIDANLRRAADLIGDFKNLAVLNTANRRSTFLLKSVLNEALATLKPTIQKANAELMLSCEEDIEVFHDQGALAQVLVNLVNNSCIHGFSEINNGLIQINIYVEGANIKIDYSDNGIGLTDEVAQRIFEPFYTTKRNQGGSGLGMNIVYNLIRQTLLGSIKISKNKPSGVVFDICFPQKAPQ
jgi:signal transduction histidine kinase